MNAEKTQTSGAGPLAGIVVVGLGRALAGPHAAMMLADLGARVIKVEAPGGGDDTRGWGPPFVDPESSRESTYFLSCNCNKESVVLDLKEAGDHAMLRAMLERADVLVENFRTGVMDRLGLDTGRLLQLNPRLVVLSLTGFGRDGPEGGRPGYDQIVQGEAGLMSLTGPGKPQKAGVPIADLLAGVYGALGVVAAVRVLEARKQSIAQRGRTARSRAGCETPELERGTPGSVTQPAWSALFWGTTFDRSRAGPDSRSSRSSCR